MDPEAISTYPYRFRDNIVGVVRGGVQLATIRKTFEAMYELELQEEGEGLQLPSLEAWINIEPKTGLMGLRLKRRTEGVYDEYRGIMRYVDPGSGNTKGILRSLIHGLALKCAFYALEGHEMRENIEGVVKELERKGYPTSWWEGKLRNSLRERGVPNEVIREVWERRKTKKK